MDGYSQDNGEEETGDDVDVASVQDVYDACEVNERHPARFLEILCHTHDTELQCHRDAVDDNMLIAVFYI